MSVDQRNNKGRTACYLCETPKQPWSVIENIPNLPENNVVCRSCVNFEGIDRIGDVIAEAVRQKREYQAQMGSTSHNGRDRHGAPAVRELSGREKLMAGSREQMGRRPEQIQRPVIDSEPRLIHQRQAEPSPRIHPILNPRQPMQPTNLVPSQSTPVTFNPHPGQRTSVMNTGMVPSIGGLTPNINPGINGPTMIPGQAGQHTPILSHPKHNGPITTIGSRTIGRAEALQPLPPSLTGVTVNQSRPSSQDLRPSLEGRVQIPGPIPSISPHVKPESVNAQPNQKIIMKTLATLKECVPFRVRFKKEPSVRGRVYGFDCTSHPRNSPELKVYIEYPIGSGSTHKTASAAAQKMSLDAVGGSMDKMTTISSGFKFLEYELKYRSEDWRLLGDFLTENVRFFKEMVNPDLIPTGFVDPNVSSPPKIPSGGSNSDSQDEDIITVDDSRPMKRPDKPSSSSEEPATKWPRKENERPNSSSPKGPPTPAKSVSPSRDPVNSPDPGQGNGQQSLLCFLCRHRLEASHFVQCPSQQLHRFCFPCCQQTIQRALQENPNMEVFCPAGQRCAIAGSQNPWAFMQAEIETILDRAGHVNNAREQRQG